jgi:hypothetical protein
VLSGYSPNKPEEILGKKLKEGTNFSDPELQFKVSLGELTATSQISACLRSFILS